MLPAKIISSTIFFSRPENSSGAAPENISPIFKATNLLSKIASGTSSLTSPNAKAPTIASLPLPASPVKRTFGFANRDKISIKRAYSFLWPIKKPTFSFLAKSVKSTPYSSRTGVGLLVQARFIIRCLNLWGLWAKEPKTFGKRLKKPNPRLKWLKIIALAKSSELMLNKLNKRLIFSSLTFPKAAKSSCGSINLFWSLAASKKANFEIVSTF